MSEIAKCFLRTTNFINTNTNAILLPRYNEEEVSTGHIIEKIITTQT